MGDEACVKCHLYGTENASLNAMAPRILRSAAVTDETTALKIEKLTCHFPIKKGLFQRTVGVVKAVDGVSLHLKKGKTLALVGESGCGKTTLGKAISLLLKPTAGEIFLNDKLIFSKTTQEIKKLRNKLQMIFQDPFSSLNPRKLVSQILAEGIKSHNLFLEKQVRRDKLKDLLDQVGLPEESMHRYPHEFSGGQRQRISIARALAVNPSILICDEPTSALDLSVQAKILNLLKELQAKELLAYLFITHDISVVGYMADDVAVMYLGRIVERGQAKEILTTPKHPYTQALLAAVPVIGEVAKKITPLTGEQPSAKNPPKGCHFASRCPHKMPVCLTQYPSERTITDTHAVCCYLYDN
jgi:peptide/nickel transport system ATP-binding protein